MSKPGWLTYVRDILIFAAGLGIVVQQTGFPYVLPSPAGGPNVIALITGAIFCNGPVVLQALALWRGGATSSSGPVSPQSPPELLSPPSAGSSSGGS